jgi:hypothetical protein
MPKQATEHVEALVTFRNQLDDMPSAEGNSFTPKSLLTAVAHLASPHNPRLYAVALRGSGPWKIGTRKGSHNVHP